MSFPDSNTTAAATAVLQVSVNITINRHIHTTMQPPTPALPVSGTFFEAAQILRPHIKIRPLSDLYGEIRRRTDSEILEGGVRSKSSDTTAVNKLVTPRLYSSETQHQVATSQVLGSLSRPDANISAARHEATFNPSSPISIFDRTNALLSSHADGYQKISEGEKVHGIICRTKSALKSLRRSKKGSFMAGNPRGSLRSGCLSASAECLISNEDEDGTDDSGASDISDHQPIIMPAWPVSKSMPKLTVSMPEKDPSTTFVEHNSFDGRSEQKHADSFSESLSITTPHRRSPNLSSVPEDNSKADKIQFYKANKDNDVFLDSDVASRFHQPVLYYKANLPEAMEPSHGYKPRSTAPAEGSPLATPSSSLKLRHTALQRTPARTMNRSTMDKTVRLAKSLEKELYADDLAVYEENAVATTAPFVRGVKPEIVKIRDSLVGGTSARQDIAVLGGPSPFNDLDSQSLLSNSTYRVRGATVPATPQAGLPAATAIVLPAPVPKLVQAACSEPEAIALVPTIPSEVLKIIVFSAAYGDAECHDMASNLYGEVAKAHDLETES